MFGKIGSFFGECRQELAKVNWPGREELMGSTVLVLVVTMIVGVYVFGIDLILSFFMNVILR